jgi:hypothetical protein
MPVLLAALLGLTGLAGCAGAPAPAGPAPVPGEAERAAAVAPRGGGEVPNQPLPGLGPVPVPDYFREGLAAGTRSADGRPGAWYWQQRVNYRIDAELDPATAILQGQEEIVYHNNSPDTLASMVFHLYQNLFSEGVERTRRVPVTGGMTLERVVVGAVEAQPVTVGRGPATGASYRVDGTLMDLRLPAPLVPGDSVVVTIAWRFPVPPRGAPRTGRIDHSVYNVAQWYPQVAVYDDLLGWNRQPYLGNGEFYLEYGDFDVSLTLPEGWLVAATGELQNPEEVLSEMTRRRLRLALERDTVIHVVTAEDLGPGNATERAPGGQLTWRFMARDVRDFAWGTSDRYLWDATRAVLPDPDRPGATKVVPVHALYRAQVPSWREAARYTRHALTFHAERWHPYVYPQMTSIEGPVGGMEYPMIVFVGGFPDARSLYGTIDHEVAHQWFPMMVGNNETSFAWQDEGLATYIEELAAQDFFPDQNAFALPLTQYLQIAGTDYERPMMREANLYPTYASFGIASYFKPAVMLRALGGIIGEDKVHEALREYARRWFLKHPYPQDFFNTVESVAGRDLDWFWTPWWYGTGVFDQGIAGVVTEPVSGGERVVVTVEDRGEVPLPTIVVVTMANGTERRATIPIENWLTGARSQALMVEVPGQVVRVELDPERLFPDVDRSDNLWDRSMAPAGPGGAESPD